jgi:hypothetical protein
MLRVYIDDITTSAILSDTGMYVKVPRDVQDLPCATAHQVTLCPLSRSISADIQVHFTAIMDSL